MIDRKPTTPNADVPGTGRGEHRRIRLMAETAKDLMSPNPVVVRGDVSLEKAAAILVSRRISAVPVMDDSGCAVGVLSHTDITRHIVESRMPAEKAMVRDAMTPAFFAVRFDTPVFSIIQEMLHHRMHRMFVTDRRGALIGVISGLDVLDYLHAE